jgi:hypothetical protein
MVNLTRIIYSSAGDLENFSAPDSGAFDLPTTGGAPTGSIELGDILIIFQEKQYSVYQYQASDFPFRDVKSMPYGCNSEATIININGEAWYLSDDGSIRATNGYTDRLISDKVKPFTNKILNHRTSKDYYGNTTFNTRPVAVWDKYNNVYRLYYAGTSSYNDKCLNYFIEKDVFTTASSTNVLSAAATFGVDSNVFIYGVSDGTGKTYSSIINYSDVDKTGTLDLGWFSSGNPKNKTRILDVEVWYHAQAGTVAGDNCDCTLTLNASIDPATNTTVQTVAHAISYNASADNLQKFRYRLNLTGEYVHIWFTDSGSKKNYAIDKICVSTDYLDSPR